MISPSIHPSIHPSIQDLASRVGAHLQEARVEDKRQRSRGFDVPASLWRFAQMEDRWMNEADEKELVGA